jgi:hypothetical protein
MTVSRTIDLPSHPSNSSGSAERFANAARAVLVAAITALVLVLLGSAAYTWGGIGDGNPDPTQWTD